MRIVQGNSVVLEIGSFVLTFWCQWIEWIFYENYKWHNFSVIELSVEDNWKWNRSILLEVAFFGNWFEMYWRKDASDN